MDPVLPIRAEQPLFGAAHHRALELRAAAPLPPHTLMQRAGTAAARLARALAPHGQRFWIAAGPGNNGGDGLEAAAMLRAAGRDVHVSLFADPAALPADAAQALALARHAGVAIDTAGGPPGAAPDCAIDALLGVGANRAPRGALAGAVHALNALDCPVLAIDLPSGLDADTGQPLGDDCVRATHTLALLALKPGLFTGAGRDLAGEIWFDDLGADPADTDRPRARLSGALAALALPPRRHAQHKGSFGDVAVVGGASGMAGAALLAARAALAAGAGRVYLDWLDAAAPSVAVDVLRPELMLRRGWSSGPSDALARSCVVCGCGGGDAVRAPLPRLLSGAGRLVLDADALNAIATDPTLATLLRARAARGLATVLTPHPLEAARLLGVATADVQADRVDAACELARRLDCVVVLKGSGSVVAAPGRTPRINATGNAALASAGTGDVLAGWLGGRWVQRSDDDAVRCAFAAARQAVAEHGSAADDAPAHSALRASDLIERLHRR